MKNKQTKQVIWILLLVFFAISLKAQNLLISFSGSGQSNTVETVEVKNIQQQTSLILSGSDTLHLVNVIGISQLDFSYEGLIIYPNPVTSESFFEFFNKSPGNISIQIYDMAGKIVAQRSMNLLTGSHTFTITKPGTGIYLLKVIMPQKILVERLVSLSDGKGAPSISYLGTSMRNMKYSSTKSEKNTIIMQYNSGETLVFKGISGIYVHTLSMVPDQSQTLSFQFIECTDGDGNHYPIVTMGNQIWMAENLKTTKYRNGNTIECPDCNNEAWKNNLTGAFAWYENNEDWKDSYGALYNWYAISNTYGLCPEGWHIPSDTEWTELTNFLGGTSSPSGNKLKSCFQVDSPLEGSCSTNEHPRWNYHDQHYGTDDYGFSGLPGGYRHDLGYYEGIGNFGYWWSSTQSGSNYAWSRSLTYHYGHVCRYGESKTHGFQVRCIKN